MDNNTNAIFDRLVTENNKNYFIPATSKLDFKGIRYTKTETIDKVFDFAFKMSFGGEGGHRDHRSGGSEKRTNGMIFANTFCGKLGECGVSNFLHKNGEANHMPDFSISKLGIWDNYDYFILVRIFPDCEKILKSLTLYYMNECSEDKKSILFKNIKNENWAYEILGFVTLDDIKFIINNKYILPKGSFLNGKVIMDAENYYVLSKDLRNINELSKIII